MQPNFRRERLWRGMVRWVVSPEDWCQVTPGVRGHHALKARLEGKGKA